MTQARVEWIDNLKAFGIILMVMGHANSPFNVYIYSFHMPLFFMISGYLFTPSISPKKTVLKKIRSLLLPFISFSLTIILIEGTFLGRHTLESLRRLLTAASTPELAGATWFLPTLFLSTVIFAYIDFYCSRVIRNILITISFIATHILLINKSIVLPYGLDLAILGSFYLMIGSSFREIQTTEKAFKNKFFLFSSVLLAGTGVYLLTNVHWAPMNWPTRSFDRFFILNAIAATCGSYLFYILAKFSSRYLKINAILKSVGENTIAILLFHFIVFKLFFFSLTLLNFEMTSYFENLTPPSEKYWFTLTVFTILVCTLISKTIGKSKLLSLLFLGKKYE